MSQPIDDRHLVTDECVTIHDINTKPGVWITDISDHMPVFVMIS